MHSSTLGDRRAVTPAGRNAAAIAEAPSPTPRIARLGLFAPPILGLPLLIVVLAGLKPDVAHPHPHAEDDRFLWQAAVFLNIIVAYLALEVAHPLALVVVSRCRARVWTIGLHCDYVAAWSFALACTLPVEFFVASGDIRVQRAHLVVLHVGFFLLFVVRVASFVHSVG